MVLDSNKSRQEALRAARLQRRAARGAATPVADEAVPPPRIPHHREPSGLPTEVDASAPAPSPPPPAAAPAAAVVESRADGAAVPTPTAISFSERIVHQRRAAREGAEQRLSERERTIREVYAAHALDSFEAAAAGRAVSAPSAGVFSKSERVSQLIQQSRSRFLRMDGQLARERTMAHQLLNRAVVAHASDFLLLFREVERAAELVAALRGVVQQTKRVASRVENVSMAGLLQSASSSGSYPHQSGPVDQRGGGRRVGLGGATQRPARLSLVQRDAKGYLTTERLNVSCYPQWASQILRSSASQVSTVKAHELFGSILSDEVGDLLAGSRFHEAAQVLMGLHTERSHESSLPLLLELEFSVIEAVIHQLQTQRLDGPLLMEALHLPLVQLLSRFSRHHMAATLFLVSQKRQMADGLRRLESTADPRHASLLMISRLLGSMSAAVAQLSRIGDTSGSPPSSVAAGGAGSGGGSPPIRAMVLLWVRENALQYARQIMLAAVYSHHTEEDSGEEPTRLSSAIATAMLIKEQLSRAAEGNDLFEGCDELLMGQLLSQSIPALHLDFAVRSSSRRRSMWWVMVRRSQQDEAWVRRHGAGPGSGDDGDGSSVRGVTAATLSACGAAAARRALDRLKDSVMPATAFSSTQLVDSPSFALLQLLLSPAAVAGRYSASLATCLRSSSCPCPVSSQLVEAELALIHYTSGSPVIHHQAQERPTAALTSSPSSSSKLDVTQSKSSLSKKRNSKKEEDEEDESSCMRTLLGSISVARSLDESLATMCEEHLTALEEGVERTLCYLAKGRRRTTPAVSSPLPSSAASSLVLMSDHRSPAWVLDFFLTVLSNSLLVSVWLHLVATKNGLGLLLLPPGGGGADKASSTAAVTLTIRTSAATKAMRRSRQLIRRWAMQAAVCGRYGAEVAAAASVPTTTGTCTSEAAVAHGSTARPSAEALGRDKHDDDGGASPPPSQTAAAPPTRLPALFVTLLTDILVTDYGTPGDYNVHQFLPISGGPGPSAAAAAAAGGGGAAMRRKEETTTAAEAPSCVPQPSAAAAAPSLWCVRRFLPSLSHFPLGNVTSHEEPALFHWFSCISCHLITTFQERWVTPSRLVLENWHAELERRRQQRLRSAEVAPELRSERAVEDDDEDGGLSQPLMSLSPHYGGGTTSYLSGGGGGSYVAAVALLQFLVYHLLKDVLCRTATTAALYGTTPGAGGASSPVPSQGGATAAASGGAGKLSDATLRQLVFFFSLFIHFWSPLFSGGLTEEEVKEHMPSVAASNTRRDLPSSNLNSNHVPGKEERGAAASSTPGSMISLLESIMCAEEDASDAPAPPHPQASIPGVSPLLLQVVLHFFDTFLGDERAAPALVLSLQRRRYERILRVDLREELGGAATPDDKRRGKQKWRREAGDGGDEAPVPITLLDLRILLLHYIEALVT